MMFPSHHLYHLTLLTSLTLTTAFHHLPPRQYIDPEVPNPGTQSCVRQWYSYGADLQLCFTTNAGAVWDNGRGCPGVLKVLNAACQPGVLDWRCEPGVDQPLGGPWVDYTTLHFCCPVATKDSQADSTQVVGGWVDEALDGIYSGAVNEFNCARA